MCARTSKNENSVLTFSALLASGFAFGGLVLGLWVGSLVIVFDGVYSLVSLLLTLLSLAASWYIQKPSDAQFPFGRAVIEPIVIIIKATTILAVVSYSLYSAIEAMFTGGREVDASIATLFGVVNVLGCGYAWWFIARKSKQHSSGLIEAESKQWQMDTLLSVAVTAGFVIAWLVSVSPASAYAVYADPLMMLLMSFYFIKVPFDMLREAARELLMMSPDKELCQKVDNNISAVEKEMPQDIQITGVTKIGRELRVDVDILTNKKAIDIKDIEQTRNKITRRLSALPYDLQLNLNISH
ncbi:putative Co/Zn/Cd cation transporter [Vibrio nigripulchritudo SOn1]|uniref:Co/Zn/Cd cation transporter n=1 Tax=Vibrio nigripulchritudo SOn1 TaxID=1238450 RepID=A0AAV2VUR7_9VIBR|nr:cation diffusion facilitator family transporter [Vibrio nigripulchritudo]CCO48410.1 putative Co/Zn/Cd cation transporter [Vibrio nigripulchritudo SOn1]